MVEASKDEVFDMSEVEKPGVQRPRLSEMSVKDLMFQEYARLLFSDEERKAADEELERRGIGERLC